MDIKRLIVYSRLNYCKVKITEGSWTEWDKITRESLEEREESIKLSNSNFYKFFLIIVFTNFDFGYPDIFSGNFYKKKSKNISGISPDNPGYIFEEKPLPKLNGSRSFREGLNKGFYGNLIYQNTTYGIVLNYKFFYW